MPQLESTPRQYREVSPKTQDHSSIVLESGSNQSNAFTFSFEAVRPNLFRTTFSSQSHPLPPFPSVERPVKDLQGCQPSSSKTGPNSHQIEVGDLVADVEWSETPLLSLRYKEAALPLHQDLRSRSYVADGTGIAHYTQHDRHALHVGLGEKAAPMDLTGRHFINSATDCFGYDSYRTDPTYKHIPLLIKATPHGCIGMFSSSYSRGTWSVGSEIDGLWGHFKVYRQDYGGLEEYLIIGRTLKDVVRTYAELAGYPLLVPKWAYGYLSGGYKYTMGDNPPAYQQLLTFADKLKEHDIPCSAHQMSSGYSIAENEPKVRNVFNWNRHRFPNPEEWIAKYHSLGIRLISNIKPFLLASHPDYEYLVESNGLFTDHDTKKSANMPLWSAGGGERADGGSVDFTSAAAYEWWVRGVQKLKEEGIDGMWNDNNEYTLPSDKWMLALDALPAEQRTSAPNEVGIWGRSLQTELMAKASYDGLRRVAPQERPFVLTRSAGAGTMRYAASSWSGDNMTSWESMKGANAQSLQAGMALMQNYGHDIGGFEGPQPSPELLLRWVQLGIYSPRFAINCFKTSPQDNQVGEAIEPWMYPEITPLIRAAIKRRYEILPYIYSLGLESHMFASPPQRWVGWNYESDPEVWSKFLKGGEEQYWFGDSLLVGGVYQPNQNSARVYLPRKNTPREKFDYGYVNTNSPHEYLASGQWVTIKSEWRDHIPVLARIGGAVQVGRNVQTRMPGESKPAVCSTLEEDDYRGVEIFPPKGSSHDTVFKNVWYEDDGISQSPEISSFEVSYSSTTEKITVGVSCPSTNKFRPPWKDLDFFLLPGDERHIVSDRGVPLDYVGKDDRARVRYRMRNVFGDDGGKMANGYH